MKHETRTGETSSTMNIILSIPNLTATAHITHRPIILSIPNRTATATAPTTRRAKPTRVNGNVNSFLLTRFSPTKYKGIGKDNNKFAYRQ